MTARAPLADPQRRLHAFLVDQAVVLAAGAAAGVLAVLAGAGATTAFLVAVCVAVVAVAALGALAGATGTSAGRAACGLRLLAADADLPLGPARGAARAVVLVALGWCSAGTAWLPLALSVARDDEGRGRGWHDRLVGSRVVRHPGGDRRDASGRPGDGASGTPRAGAAVVDLTALRVHPSVPAPRAPSRDRPSPRVLPGRWQVDVDGAEVLEVVDRLRLEDVELVRMPDGALVVRGGGSEGGTLLIRGGAARTVAPGRVTTLLPDDRLRVGERWVRVVGTEHAPTSP